MNILVPRGFRQVFAVLHNTDVIASNHSPPSFLSPINNVVCFLRIIIAFKQKIKLEIVKFAVFFVKFAKSVLDSIKIGLQTEADLRLFLNKDTQSEGIVFNFVVCNRSVSLTEGKNGTGADSVSLFFGYRNTVLIRHHLTDKGITNL